MCGFLGACDFIRGINTIHPALQKGLERISHRGPDGSKEINSGNVYFAQNRLSIIDLSSKADQPFRSYSHDAQIIFNGEIYNYKDLKKNLDGVRFETSSDTEVILEGYLKEGADFFKKLRGIYSLAIFDNRIQPKVILVRDPSGIKPFYIYHDNGLTLFGSEIKALLPAARNKVTINEDVLKCYLNLGYCLEPNTIYKEIMAVEPGHVIEITSAGLSERSLFEYSFTDVNDLSYDCNVEKTESLLKTAVERNLVADVEVAVALSGGIDSSLIYAFANEADSRIRGLTVRSDDEEYNEEEISKIYSQTLKGKHELVEIDKTLNLETLNHILKDFDQPFADSSAINVYYLTKATRKVTKVLIGGDGGDELYNGYPSMTWLTYIDRLNRNAFTKFSGEKILDAARLVVNSSQRRLVKRISDLWTNDPYELLYDWHCWFPRKTVFEGVTPFLFDTQTGVDVYRKAFESKAPSEFRKFVVYDYFRKQMLSDYLRKTDMMSMLNSVEYRVPMLDEDLTSFALSIPFEQKSTLKTTKKILREIHRKKYPEQTSRLSKKGFTIPLDTALPKEDFRIIEEELLTRGNIVTEYIKKDYVRYLFKALEERTGTHEISRAGVYQRILMLYSLSLWNSAK